MPGVPVELSTITLVHDSRPQFTSRALAAPAGSSVAIQQSVTAADGSYQFLDLPPGAYTVTASVSIAGFSYTSDSDGGADWTVHVDLSGTTDTQADFGGIGHGSLNGSIFNSTTQAPISSANVTCRWAGLDDILGDADDVLMSAVANASGGFGLPQIPYGLYTCSGRDPVTGATSATARTSVMSPVPAKVQLPIVQTPGRRQGLPRTGAPETTLVALALTLLLAGAGSLKVGRARRNR
ncbi:MAG TPA: hypothetical protein VJT31_02835 [Rugosimonospora sp.]|nr:hypothetical protein [Rugosimonospora sp.]